MHLFLKYSLPLGLTLFFGFFPLSVAAGMIMIGVIIGSRKMGINPDNVATPIAASLGDLITLALLSGISWGLYKELGEEQHQGLLSLIPPSLPLGWVGFLLWSSLGRVREGKGPLSTSSSSSPGEVLREGLALSRCLVGAGAVAEGGFGFHLLSWQLQPGILRAGLQLETPNFLLPPPPSFLPWDAGL